jgi:hypothetical protein
MRDLPAPPLRAQPNLARVLDDRLRPGHLDKLIWLERELVKAEAQRLRQRLLHTAAKLVRHGRRIRLKLDRDWPWASALAAAFDRLRNKPGALLG